ncbi:MAG: hypothetical protein PHO83_07190 [Geobacteraceae bacterium]|nr:hypothetical protein [Geobacteraceae bacterium]
MEIADQCHAMAPFRKGGRAVAHGCFQSAGTIERIDPADAGDHADSEGSRGGGIRRGTGTFADRKIGGQFSLPREPQARRH